ncbi:hypothetical protein BC829DRAFT_190681 [Chytridium lagenaria]|nr:hypothetical protein BC829DRAFT_190681 [Chytridium lagenaria]
MVIIKINERRMMHGGQPDSSMPSERSFESEAEAKTLGPFEGEYGSVSQVLQSSRAIFERWRKDQRYFSNLLILDHRACSNWWQRCYTVGPRCCSRTGQHSTRIIRGVFKKNIRRPFRIRIGLQVRVGRWSSQIRGPLAKGKMKPSAKGSTI